MKTTAALIIVAALLAAGCVSSGNTKVGSMNENLARVEVPIGASKAQVERTFGAPDVKTFGLDGAEVWTYQHTYATPKAASFIPLVGAFAGGVNAERKQLTVLFDAQGAVARVLWNAGETEIRYGR